MSTTVTAMRSNRASIAAKITALDTQLAEFRASQAYELAPVEDRERAERPMLAERRELSTTFLTTQRGLADGARKAWLAVTPASVQRKAAIENPARAVAVAQLAALAGPREAEKLAALLVASADAPGAYGLRCAVAQLPVDAHGAAVAIALKAGTSESDDALKTLLAAQRELARSVGAVGSAEDMIAAAHAAQEVAQEDGSAQWYSEAAVEEMIGPPDGAAK